MVNKTLLPPGHNSAKHLTPSKTDIFRTGTAFALTAANRGLGEPWRFEGSAKDEPGRVLASRLIEGENTDGEYASRRTFTADGAGAADGRRRQQRRERQHQRLQGRPVDVPGISRLGRER